MTWVFVLWVLTIAVCATWCVLKWREQDKADHAKCIAHIASVTSNRTVAVALRAAADRYESVDGEAELVHIRNAYTGETPVPALWMRVQADKIDPTEWELNEVAL